jgi:hypothetical protein
MASMMIRKGSRKGGKGSDHVFYESDHTFSHQGYLNKKGARVGWKKRYEETRVRRL